MLPNKFPYKPDGILTNETITSIVDIHSYKLDVFSKKAIVNDTIKCPSVRAHCMIVYGNDTYGDEYRSEKRYFTVLPFHKAPSLSDNITITQGNLKTYGDLEFIDGNYSVFNCTPIDYPLIRFVDSITYTESVSGAGTIENMQTDDENYKQILSEKDYYGNPIWEYLYTIRCSFNFDPGLAGRNFYLSIDLVSTKSGSLKVNGQAIRTGTTIDEDDIYIEDVTSISWDAGSRWTNSFNTKFYYFKLVDESGTTAKLNFTVNMEMNVIDLYAVIRLQYSHKTNISTAVDLDIWNWDTSTWHGIESVDNYASFDDDSFVLGKESPHVNSSFGVRFRYQAINPSYPFQIEVDQLRLEYSFEIGDIINEVPIQPDNFTFTKGSFTSQDDIEYLDGNYSVIASSEPVNPPNEYVDSITYTKSVSGTGTIENMQNDDDNYKQINTKKTYYGNPIYDYLYTLRCSFNFDPALAGRDFYLSIDLVSTKSGSLKVNGQAIRTGTTIDEDDIYIEDVTSISWDAGSRWSTSFNTKFYYFKLVEVGEAPATINFTVDIEVSNPDCTLITTLQYSHKTNISVPVALDIWNWVTSSWDNIENISNTVDFDVDFFVIGLESDYVNSTFGVRVKFEATHETSAFKLEIDRLRLDYTNYS